jgi:hypothetical protein
MMCCLIKSSVFFFLSFFEMTVRLLLPFYASPFRRRLIQVVEVRLALSRSCVLGLEDGAVERVSAGRKLFPALLSDAEYVLSSLVLIFDSKLFVNTRCAAHKSHARQRSVSKRTDLQNM